MINNKKPEDSLNRRLDTLTNAWNNTHLQDISNAATAITASDLRILLENKSPLSDLINTIIDSAITKNNNQQTSIEEQTNAKPSSKAPLSTENNSSKEINNLKNELKERTNEILKIRESEKKLKLETNNLKEKINNLEAELKETKSKTINTNEIDYLISDKQLRSHIGLDDIPSDTTSALISIVSVLSQIENIKRLWELLKDRCEIENRPANPSEFNLLYSALNWHNHNWKKHPYQLIKAETNSSYNYETQSRSQNNNKGETVKETRLPGIADGKGKALCKALVDTI